MTFDTESLNSLFRYCLSLTRHREDALDLAHSALEKYLTLNDSEINEPTHYVRRIARNLFYDQRRFAKRYPVESHSEELPQNFNERELEDSVIDGFTLEAIWKTLQPAEREVIYLWAVDGMTASEIALHLGQPRGTILARLYRLKQRVQHDYIVQEQDGHG
ncbi:MAG: RNA polymerase sigma factor [Moraxellaceae bacterium]|nr:RNA polymerase sigma factor [Moraxellaceae bacterium]MDZ4385738.1 RNA polymerase sigma factor [Moraxellaceae bacterium]